MNGGDAGYRGVTRWTPEAEPCADCGDPVNRRWHTPSGPVCAACVAWRSA